MKGFALENEITGFDFDACFGGETLEIPSPKTNMPLCCKKI